MLTFAVYDGDEPAHEWTLQQAYLLGNEDVGVHGAITFDDGLIRCDKRSIEPAGLALLVDVGDHGRLLLQTCLLPDRDQPYLLYVELARHRIKTFLVKIEDWLLFELEPDHPILALWNDARSLLTEAVILETAHPARAETLARESLIKGVSATEQLAMMHADILLAKRFAAGSMPSRALGCLVHQSQFAEPLARAVADVFDSVAIPIRWREVEPEEGAYDWSRFDRWMEWAHKNQLHVMAGPLIDFRPLSVPEWLAVWEHDYDTTHDLLHQHVEAIIRRYKEVVSVWNIATSLHINENFTLGYEQMMDVIRMSTSLAKSIHPSGHTVIEITEPFGEYFAANPKSVPPIPFAETIAQAGYKIDYLGLHIQIGHHQGGRTARDLMQLSALLDRLLFTEMPVIITGLGAPSARPKTDEPDPAGWWREPWSPEHQADWLARTVALCLSKPFVEGVYINELYDHAASELPASGLISRTGRGKPALEQMSQVHSLIRRGSLRCSPPNERNWVVTEMLDSDADNARTASPGAARGGDTTRGGDNVD